MNRPEHGGDVRKLQQQFNLPADAVWDLSTGVSPFAYPLPAMPISELQQMPYPKPELQAIAASYYGVSEDQLLAAPGSQAIIQILPRLRPRSRVLLPAIGYEEHRYCWQRAGHELHFYHDTQQIEALLATQPIDVLVVIHPNNPTAEYCCHESIKTWRNSMAEDSWLIVDEAFIDAEPERSVSNLLPMAGLIILRSVGKFFGLPGLRLGFALADRKLLNELKDELGPWPICALAQWAGVQLLADFAWHSEARNRLLVASQQLCTELKIALPELDWVRQTPFFCSTMLAIDHALEIQHAMAQQGVLVRVYRTDGQACLRVGLPPLGRRLSDLYRLVSSSIGL
ncbi:threonine-phosphate decarboxylase [Spongiibacter sp. KMU-158]|uniref:threonine-phosphate decarboxylase n=1 Tax=Spongiibacter pelagi TaxID=2760804 RepID=A0A927C0Q2_9GAMM|nr:threonine-phosphate decarboxylase CobD [Spongiibacter pelagi]MBD2859110.1 threonine-phosphate decarboxylase [Spongiibacter pelagi]